MANKSNWKYSEVLASRLLPNARRRTRTQGFSYATIADDVIGPCQEVLMTKDGEIRVVKRRLFRSGPAIYVEVKKQAANATTKIFKDCEKKYFTHEESELVLVIHPKSSKRLFVMISDRFFKELFAVWFEKAKTQGDDDGQM